MALALVQLSLQERDNLPAHIVLDCDGTDDPAHGEQEGVADHSFYNQYMYHLLLVFDGETGQLITAILRPGTCHSSRGAVANELRADSGFAVLGIYNYYKQHYIAYTIALVSNDWLEAMAAPLAKEAQ